MRAKRILGLLMAIMMLLAVQMPALAEEEFFDDDPSGEPAATAGGAATDYVFPGYSYDELVIGNPTPVEGKFFTDMWGNNTSDLDVRTLIHGYDLVSWDGENGMYIMNPTVIADGGTVVLENADHDRSYLMTLYSDLRYSDGTPISARDYAFALLLRISPLISELGGVPLRPDYIQGYQEYISGQNPVLTGVRVVSNNQLMITVRHEYLPFFYELGLLSVTPAPIDVIAPGCSVVDNGEGVSIEGPFTAELLKKTILDPETGYLSHPSPVSGPYMLTAFDGKECEFEINPNFKGDPDGMKPMIQKIRLVPVENDTMVSRLGEGELGLLNKVTRADVIDAGAQLVGTGYYATSNYPRIGMTAISFNCEKPTVSEQAVRQAIALCVNKDQLIADYAGNFGLRVDGYYGLGQWMYQLVNGTMMYPVEDPEGAGAEELASWQALSLDSIPKYNLDVEGAKKLLSDAGWNPGADGIREKTVDGKTVRLSLKMAYPEGNKIANSIETNMISHLKEAGIEMTLVPMDMSTLLSQYYRKTDREVDMFYLGTNFDVLFDPAAHFLPDAEGKMTWDYTGAQDDELQRLALDMRKTEPGDLLGYCTKWLAFQQRFAEVCPMIPVYSNVYFDYFPTVLHNYYPASNATWSEAVVSAYMSDPGDVQEEEEADEGEEFFD